MKIGTFVCCLGLWAAFGDASRAATTSVINRFNGLTGATPVAGLIADSGGNLYGTTENGGSVGVGTVFRLSPPAPGETKWKETVLYAFTDLNGTAPGNGDGAFPAAPLIMDKSGALYGTTQYGGTGSSKCGTAFKLTRPSTAGGAWTRTTLYSFDCYLAGATPSTGVIMDADGALYGATKGGGGSALGIVFKLTPPVSGQTGWTETILHNFGPLGIDGVFPTSLVSDGTGGFYGTTEFGGQCPSAVGGACGTVFSLTPPASGQAQWTERIIYQFAGGSDGAHPAGGLIVGHDGALYGTTLNSTDNGCEPDFATCGTIFKLAKDSRGQWQETVLYGFPQQPGPQQGSQPDAALLEDRNGALFGTTSLGGAAGCNIPGVPINCGTAFRLKPPKSANASWTYTTLFNFPNGSKGGNPQSSLYADASGALFGTATQAGVTGAECQHYSYVGCGTVFRIKNSGFVP